MSRGTEDKKPTAAEMKHFKVLGIITAIRNSFPGAQEHYERYPEKLFKILQAAFSSAEQGMYNSVWVTKIGDRMYSITGEIIDVKA